jgi:outer membrane usher protein
MGEASLLLQGEDEEVWASLEDLKQWRLVPQPSPRLSYLGKVYLKLSVLRGISYRVDLSMLKLSIEVAPEAFERSTREAQGYSSPPPDTPHRGGFLNYDLFGSTAPDGVQKAGLFELGLFGSKGVLTNTGLFRDAGTSHQVLRLETTLFRDRVDALTSLQLGDSLTHPGAWGRSLRFGGLRYATNFAVQPGLITFPLQRASGQATVPSVVDIYVNNALVTRQVVPPGSFSITRIPVVTGDGEMQLVVTDLFGRQQLTTQRFYASSNLLREGLADYSYELGFARRNFGLVSNDYGPALGSATYRKGLSSVLTAESHVEAKPGLVAAGAEADVLFQDIGVASAGIAGSRSNAGTGALALLGFERQARTLSYGFHTRRTTSEFRQLGFDGDLLPPRRITTANAGYQMGRSGSIALALAVQEFPDRPRSAAVSATYTINAGALGTVFISATRSSGPASGNAIFATLSVPLSSDTSLSVSQAFESSRSGPAAGSATTAALQRSLPAGNGYGYRLLGRDDGTIEAGLSLQNDVGTYTVEGAQHGGISSGRLQVAGGIGWMEGQTFLSRKITDSFALVRVSDYPRVRVLQDNQMVGMTDANGYALLPRLRAYERNRVAVEQSDLPLDAVIDRLALEVIPYYRSGVYAEFPIHRSKSATLKILLEDGSPVPAGATARLDGNANTFPVGENGDIFLTDLSQANRLRVSWQRQTCQIDFEFAPDKDPLPDLGAFVCKSVRR